METLTVAETIGRACKIRPALAPILRAFEPLLAQRRATAEKLAPLLAEAGISLSGQCGEDSLLARQMPAGLGHFVRMAGRDLLALLLAQPALAPHGEALSGLFLAEDRDCDRELLVSACLAEDPDGLVALAEKYGTQPEVVSFAADFIVSAVLTALARNVHSCQLTGWQKGVCPVCGTPPVIAWLGRRPIAENNEFLTDGGGKKHLHCGMCGTDWHFLRGVCPGCGTHGQDAMQILGEEDRRHERIDWCKKCRSYLPQIDLREISGTPDMDAMTLCLMHLDIVAAEKELVPLKPSFWNMF